MRKYWLLDRHGEDGPSALIETDGSMRVARILKFGPGITELDDQQTLHDAVMGKVAPTLKPLVDGSSLKVDGVEPHAELIQSTKGGGTTNRAGRRKGSGTKSGGRAASGPSRAGGRGDR